MPRVSDYPCCPPASITKRDAILYSVGVNSDHGLRRSNDDKRQAIMTLLKDEEWSQWSDSEIARQCAVDQTTVSKHRRSLREILSDNSRTRTYTTKHGTTAVMHTEAISQSGG